MANIIINTTAVRNNGDVALIVTLAKALEERGHFVTFATPHSDQMRNLHGICNVCGEVLGYKKKIFRRRYFSDLSAVMCLVFSRIYRNADVILGAPGGYINSYYGFGWRRAIYRWAHRFGKKTAIYAQSVGPLDEKDRNGLASFSNYIDVLMTRDTISYENALSVGFLPSRLIRSNDAIFLKPPTISAESARSNIVAISVREWVHEQRDIPAYSEMISRLAEILLLRGFEIEFISTCQGIAGYIDDSAIATNIERHLRNTHGQEARITVNTSALSINELTSLIPSYRLVLGTRLHMCLLALISGVPAFNISYEIKGSECYAYLGLSDYSIDYNTDFDLAEQQFQNFLDSEIDTRARLPEILREQHERASRDFESFLNTLGLE